MTTPGEELEAHLSWALEHRREELAKWAALMHRCERIGVPSLMLGLLEQAGALVTWASNEYMRAKAQWN